MINMVKLSDVSKLTVGYVGSMEKEYTENGIKFLRSLNVKPFSFDLSDVRYITKEFNNKISKSILHTNDVVIVRTGIPGTAAVVPEELDGCNCSDLVIVRPDTLKINPHFLCAFINSWGESQIKNVKVGAVQKHFNVSSAQEMLVPFPKLEEQNMIADIIYNLNSKITLNNSICSDLESMAKLLYDYWFMQFDFPDENGRPYKSGGGKMVWNDELKREIPEGWNAKMIGDTDIYVSDYTANGSFKGLADNVKYNEGIPYAMLIRIVDFNNNFENVNNHIWIDKHGYDYLAKSNLQGDEIIICNVGAAGNVYRCPRFNHPMTLGPNGIVVNHEYLNNYLDLYFSSSIGQNQLHAISSGSIQLKFNKTNFRELYIPVPRKEIIDNFYMIYNPIFEKKCSVLKENKELASLRDFLLPMLMNGQIKIEDVKAS